MNINPGSFAVVGQSGVPAMHLALLPNGNVMFLDKVENYTQLKLSNDRFAYSAEYDPRTNAVMPLAYRTNAFCAGGAQLANGIWISVGGNAPLTDVDPSVADGFDGIRYLRRSPADTSFDGQDWIEPGNKLASARWYPSLQTMVCFEIEFYYAKTDHVKPDGSIIVVSGSLNGLDPNVPTNNNPTYEILDRNGVSSGVSVPMAVLSMTQVSLTMIDQNFEHTYFSGELVRHV